MTSFELVIFDCDGVLLDSEIDLNQELQDEDLLKSIPLTLQDLLIARLDRLGGDSDVMQIAASKR